MPEPNDEQKEIKELLERGEVKTMRKDVAELREKEAEAERERIAALSAEKEAKIGEEKREELLKEAEERKKLAEETRRKEEEFLKRAELEETRLKAAKDAGEKKEKELFEFVGEKTKEIWKKEEEERKKFLERVGVVKESGEAAILEPEPKKEIPLIPEPPQKPSPFKKFLIRGIVIMVVLFLAGFSYWYFGVKRAGLPEGEKQPPSEETLPPKEEIIEELEVQVPPITERILDWGYYIPTATRTIDTIIIHSVYNVMGGDVYDVEKVIDEFRIYRVTSHYLISRDGAIYQLAPDKAIAYQAGISRMPDGSRVNIINNFSIGIELIYTKAESPTEAQYQILAQLVKYLKQQYNIPPENILGQNEIAPERKTDPWNFDWEKFNKLLK